MNKLTAVQMEKKRVFAKARLEGSFVRDTFLNEIMPEVEKEFDRRVNTGESLNLQIPDGKDYVAKYLEDFYKINNVATKVAQNKLKA